MLTRPTNGNTCESISPHVRVSVFNRTENSTYVIRVHMISLRITYNDVGVYQFVQFVHHMIYPNALA